MSHVYFFATSSDIGKVLMSVGRLEALEMVLVDHMPNRIVNRFTISEVISRLGSIPFRYDDGEEYLVLFKGADVAPVSILNNQGKYTYIVDQRSNPDTITFSPGGLYGDDILVRGRIASVSDTADSKNLMRLFSKEIRSSFEKIKSCWVGCEAAELLDSGKRLTLTNGSSPVMDLRR
jgi:hypothetical protein